MSADTSALALAIFSACCSGLGAFYFNRELAKLKNRFDTEQKQREKSALIAELLAESRLHQSNTSFDMKKLNRLAWEAFLWLPPDINTMLVKYLTGKPDAPNIVDLLVAVRKLLHGQADPLTRDDVATMYPDNDPKFPNPEKALGPRS